MGGVPIEINLFLAYNHILPMCYDTQVWDGMKMDIKFNNRFEKVIYRTCTRSFISGRINAPKLT